MGYAQNMQNTLRLIRWQDYRGSKESFVVNFESSPGTELPIRDLLNDSGKGPQSEPNIETGTIGYGRCADASTRNSFVKKRKGYILFLTQYTGSLEEYRGRNFIVGYYHINQVADVRKHHMRSLHDNICPEIDFCFALRAADMKFIRIQDAFELSVEKLKAWGYKGKIARQFRLALNAEKTSEVLTHFADKQDATQEYIVAIEAAVAKIKKPKLDESEAAEDGAKNSPLAVQETTPASPADAEG